MSIMMTMISQIKVVFAYLVISAGLCDFLANDMPKVMSIIGQFHRDNTCCVMSHVVRQFCNFVALAC